jgi:hypothetical protein|tara:strand:- start:5916 stop:6161 length:246 start_codon:yes stop_codon:yes gene_type:complete
MAPHDILGTIGVGFIIVMYAMLQLGKISAERPAFSAFNALGAVFILISLTYEFNLSAALMEGVWLVVSLYGLWKALSSRRP